MSGCPFLSVRKQTYSANDSITFRRKTPAQRILAIFGNGYPLRSLSYLVAYLEIIAYLLEQLLALRLELAERCESGYAYEARNARQLIQLTQMELKLTIAGRLT